MSGPCQQRRLQSRWERYNVSISQSSGFSCQGNAVSDVSPLGNLSLFPSRYRAASHFRICCLYSGSIRCKFQSRYRAASHFRGFDADADVGCIGFNLVIERLLISGASLRDTFIQFSYCFNLVIERLLISGISMTTHPMTKCGVSISLSSGFSFQALASVF